MYSIENIFGNNGYWKCSGCGITYEGTKPFELSEKAERVLNRPCCQILDV
jgi:hypothetical protein